MTSSSQAMRLSRSVQTHALRRLAFAFLVLLLLAPCLAAAQERAWQLSLELLSERLILGEPIWADLAVSNVSGHTAPQAVLSGRFYLDGAAKPCRPHSAPAGGGALPGGEGDTVRPVSPPRTAIHAWVDLAYECNLARPQSPEPRVHTICYRDDRSSDLIRSSACVSFVILPPEGVDSQAYEAFDHQPLKYGQHYGELLARFPISTYAAYVVWQKYAKGWAGVKTERTIGGLVLGFKHQTGLTLCDSSARPTGEPETRLVGRLYVACRDNWLNLVLKNHPNIWFGDEVRLKLALDRYLLGDKDGCEAGLGDLAEHGKPYVATKAGELLAAMRAKGMLGEASK